MSLLPDNVIAIVGACYCLHNYLMLEGRARGGYFPPYFGDSASSSEEFTPGDWRKSTEPLKQVNRQGSSAFARRVAEVRDSFASYFHGTGAVTWQWM